MFVTDAGVPLQRCHGIGDEHQQDAAWSDERARLRGPMLR